MWDMIVRLVINEQEWSTGSNLLCIIYHTDDVSSSVYYVAKWNSAKQYIVHAYELPGNHTGDTASIPVLCRTEIQALLPFYVAMCWSYQQVVEAACLRAVLIIFFVYHGIYIFLKMYQQR